MTITDHPNIAVKQLNKSTILAINNISEPHSGGEMLAANVTLVMDFTLQGLTLGKMD